MTTPKAPNANEDHRQPPFGKIAREITESGLDPWPYRLYGFLCTRQGQQGYKTYGTQYVADCLGWDRDTVSKYASVLEDLGLIRITTKPRSKTIYEVIHNPAWKIINPDAILPPLEKRYRREGYKGPTTGAELAKNASKAGGNHLTHAAGHDDDDRSGPHHPPEKTIVLADDTGHRSPSVLADDTGATGPQCPPLLSSSLAIRGSDSSKGLSDSVSVDDEATNTQCEQIKAAMYAREWDWAQMAHEIEDITGRSGLLSPKGLTVDEAAAVLDSLAADGRIRQSA